MKKLMLPVLAISTLSCAANAEQYWSDNSFSLVYGDNFKQVPSGESSKATAFTLEHVSGHNWGSVFFFVDRINGGTDYDETYSEVSPNFTIKKFDNSFVREVYVATTYEYSSSATGTSAFSQDNYLVGAGVSLAIPGMDYFNVNLYRAQNNNNFGRFYDNQLTLVYGWSYENFTIDGFLDYTPARQDGREDELNFTPQLTYNVGPALGLKNKVKVGVEYSYWVNKFGVSKEDQNNVSLILKWHL